MPRYRAPLPGYIEPADVEPYRLSCLWCKRGGCFDPHGKMWGFTIRHHSRCPAIARIEAGLRCCYLVSTLP